MRVELLAIPGCPHSETARRVLRAEMAALGVPGPITEIVIADEAEARAAAFPGSPTIRVDGADVEPVVGPEAPASMACRVYATGEGLQGWPSADSIRAALRAARAGDT